MKLAQSQRRALCAFAGLAAIQAAPALASDDKSTMTSVMELVGVSSDDGVGKIDYSERPKLVLPPNHGVLPPPRERAERPGGWPNELSSERRRNADRYARVPNAPAEEKKGLIGRVGVHPAPGQGAEEEQSLLQRWIYGRKGSSVSAVEEPNRHLLTEPPPGYRRPTQDLTKLRDHEVKKSSWWNPLSWGGGGGGSESTPNLAAPDSRGGGESTPNLAAPDSRGGGIASTLSGMMPSFLRGNSDDDRN